MLGVPYKVNIYSLVEDDTGPVESKALHDKVRNFFSPDALDRVDQVVSTEGGLAMYTEEMERAPSAASGPLSRQTSGPFSRQASNLPT